MLLQKNIPHNLWMVSNYRKEEKKTHLKKWNWYKNSKDKRNKRKTHAYFSMQIIPVGMRVAIKREMK